MNAKTLGLALGVAALSFCSRSAVAMENEPASSALKKLTLEELMNIEVTSVSRAPESLSDAAAAITVITQQEIRRSGATTIPELLRGVPGLHVAQQNANSWAVSSRGFSSVNSEKLLVLSDTRSIYTPLFSGVSWDVQDYLLQDIERIEVIRGPGAALWGSNAVNGVINITTKRAQDTQGLYLEAAAGDEERINAAARFGGQMQNGIAYRVFGKFFDRDATVNPNPFTSDEWRLGHVGLRADWDVSGDDALTFQAETYEGEVGQWMPSLVSGRPGPTGDLEADVSGGNVLGRWRHRIDEDSELQFRAYYDRTRRDDPTYKDELDTIDLDLQHRFNATLHQQIIWGLNYRLTDSRAEGQGVFAPGLDPISSNDQLVSAFVQDQISINDSLRVTLGTKLEHNDFSGFEVQPSARASWQLTSTHTVWSAISRAVRVPTRQERDVAINATDPAGNPVVRLLGNEDFDSEELTAYELGHRWQPLSMLLIDIAAFYHRYEGLVSVEQNPPFLDPDGRIIIPVTYKNLNDGHSQGIETLVTYSPYERWRLVASYSYIDMSLDAGGQDVNRGRFLEGSTPRHQFSLRSSLDLPGGIQLDAQFRDHSAIRQLPDIVTGEGISGYSELDVRVAWMLQEQLELSLVGQNLLHDRHIEFGTPERRGEIERSFYAKLSWGF